MHQRHFAFALEEFEPGWWRFRDAAQSGATSFDFQLAPEDPALLDERCAFLQTSPEFGLRAQRGRATSLARRPLRHDAWQGADLHRGRCDDPRSPAQRTNTSKTLRSIFALDLPEAAALWPKIEARHRVLFEAG